MNPARWALAASVALALALGSIASGTASETAELAQENASLEEAVAQAQEQAARAGPLVRELGTLHDTWSERARALPPLEVATEERFLTTIQHASDATLVPVNTFQVSANPPRPLPGGGAVVELVARIEHSGTWTACVAFLDLVERSPGLTQVRSFTVNAAGPDGEVSVTLEVSTFRYRAKQAWE